MKNRYLIRSAKYFVYLMVIFIVLFGILIATNFSSWEIFLRVWTTGRTVWVLVAAFVVLPLLYPMFGFARRDLRATFEEDRELLERILAMSGYTIETQQPDRWTARAGGIKRFNYFFEDRVTLTADGSRYVTVEGPRKEVVKMEYRLRTFK